MLDWLKKILGEGYSEEIDKRVSEEIGKSFVARADFNTLNTEKKNLSDTVKERDRQLEALKSTAGDVEALKSQITTLQAENQKAKDAHEAEIKSLKIDAAVEMALSAAKAKNIKAVKALLQLDQAEIQEDGTVKGLEEQIKTLRESEDSGFLFGSLQMRGAKHGESGGDRGSSAPDYSKMTYEELAAYMEENPDAATE